MTQPDDLVGEESNLRAADIDIDADIDTVTVVTVLSCNTPPADLCPPGPVRRGAASPLLLWPSGQGCVHRNRAWREAGGVGSMVTPVG